MTDLLFLVISAIAIIVCAIVQPERATCPAGFYVGTLRPSGSFVCVKIPPRAVCDGKAGCDDATSDAEIRGRLYCTGGAVPVTNAYGNAVGCQRVF